MGKEVVMNIIKQKDRQITIALILTGWLLLFWAPLANAQNNSFDMSIANSLFVQGSVKRISLGEKIITVKPNKEERVKIQIDEHTDFVGMTTLEELTKGQRVKVWYTAVEDINRAKKVERLPDLGC